MSQSTLSAIFFIESPLSLLSAIEAIKKFRINQCDLVLLTNSSQRNSEQLEAVSKLIEWRSLTRFRITRWQTLYPRIKWLSRKFRREYDYAFAGDVFCRYMNVLLANTQTKHRFFLDDGSKSIGIDTSLGQLNSDTKARILHWFCFCLGMKSSVQVDELKAFSFFERLSPKVGEWHRHNFQNLRETLTYPKTSPKVIFVLGQSIVERGVADISVYRSFLQRIGKKFPSATVYYVPHRHENIEGYEGFVKNLGWKILKFSVPIELAFTQLGYMPEKVITFYSTALITLKAIYPELETNFMRLPEDSLKREKGDIIKFYKFLSTQTEELIF